MAEMLTVLAVQLPSEVYLSRADKLAFTDGMTGKLAAPGQLVPTSSCSLVPQFILIGELTPLTARRPTTSYKFNLELSSVFATYLW